MNQGGRRKGPRTSFRASLPPISTFPSSRPDATGPKHLDMRLTRTKFKRADRRPGEIHHRARKQALSDSGLSAEQIDKVCFWWAVHKGPLRAGRGQEQLGRSPTRGSTRRVRGLGAALQAGVLGGDVIGSAFRWTLPHAVLGIETIGRRLHPPDRTEHHHPHQEKPDLFHRGRRADLV